jgi:hypothetical protein
MINARMSDYDYYLLNTDNGYGQITTDLVKQGTVKLSISTLTQTVTEDLRYSEASYIGLTQDKQINDTYLIQYGNTVLKVLYVNPDGRYTQVFLGVYG